jgi:hypothetical protein
MEAMLLEISVKQCIIWLVNKQATKEKQQDQLSEPELLNVR